MFKYNFPLMDVALSGLRESQDDFMKSLTAEQVWNWHETHRCIGVECAVCEEYVRRFGSQIDPQAYDGEPVEVLEGDND